MSEEEQKYFKGLIGFTFDSDDIRYIKKIVDKKDKEIERLNNIIKDIKKCIDYYAIENDDFSKFYNNEEIEILNIIGSDKVE